MDEPVSNFERVQHIKIEPNIDYSHNRCHYRFLNRCESIYYIRGFATEVSSNVSPVMEYVIESVLFARVNSIYTTSSEPKRRKKRFVFFFASGKQTLMAMNGFYFIESCMQSMLLTYVSE